MSKFHEIDTVKILVPVSGTSEVKRESVSFPAGTEGTLIVAGKGGGWWKSAGRLRTGFPVTG